MLLVFHNKNSKNLVKIEQQCQWYLLFSIQLFVSNRLLLNLHVYCISLVNIKSLRLYKYLHLIVTLLVFISEFKCYGGIMLINMFP